jgi:hypothetical protein
MPNLKLTEKDAESLIHYINSRTAALKPVTSSDAAVTKESSANSMRD